MSQYCDRPVLIVDMPMPADARILRPEHTLLRFRNQTTMDVGALCYLRREATKDQGPRRAVNGRKVELSSLCFKRVERIRTFISYISEQVRHGAKRASTVHKVAQDFARFVTWADENGYSSLLEDAEATRAAVIAYADHISRRVRSHSISVDYGAVAQRQTFAILAEFLQIENLTRGINLLRKNSITKPTAPPGAVNQGRTLLLCEVIFNGLAELVLEAKRYPFAIDMPSYLGYPNNTMWVIPNATWCMPNSRIAVKDSFGAFNYREG